VWGIHPILSHRIAAYDPRTPRAGDDMTDVAGRRMTAEIEGDFVVFLTGARFNN
jgi:hypothetical protein